jgi:hypothetical protein
MPKVHFRSTSWSHPTRHRPARFDNRTPCEPPIASASLSIRPPGSIAGLCPKNSSLIVTAITSSSFWFRETVWGCFPQPSSQPFIVWRVDMKLLTQSHRRVQRPASLLEWHHWFAWYPVPTAINGRLHYAWLRSVERKWGIGSYTGTIKWRYRLPRRSRSRRSPSGSH